ncbi:hypothetical protein ACH3VR_05015 [Microbacterium sp. B2969]|uniref:Zinc ribbon domain-containing protein n=1 Tax=Microbacterium alkaliflavum TaxID=3248839 RepID=A0ABW7Q4E0_9MICO
MTDVHKDVVCLECGGHNLPGEQFCGNCGAYLAWEPESAENTAVAAPPAETEPDASAPASSAVPAEGSATAAPTVAPPPADVAPDSPRNSEDAPTATRQPTSAAPVLRKPTAAAPPRPRPPVAVPDRPAPAPGDLVCPACGWGNRPDRHFCRHCAAPLTAPKAVVQSVQPVAGARPKGRSVRFPFTAVVVLAMMIVLIVVGWLNRDGVIGFVRSIIGFVFSTQSP